MQTGVFQTQQISGLETAAAAAGAAALQSEATLPPVTAAECPRTPDAPGFGEISLPAALGQLEQSGDSWLLNDTEVMLVNHVNADCSLSLWLTLAGVTDWPLLLQDGQGAWQIGSREWTTEIVVMNTNEVGLRLEVLPLVVGSQDAEGQVEQLGAYEIFNIASLPPGQYRFMFSFEADQTLQLSCTVSFQPNSRYVFSVVPVGVAIFSDQLVPENATDVDITTSPLCQG